MIIWLASYPKSGNTWIRTILNQLLYSVSEDKNKIFEGLDRIRKYPTVKDFSNISKKFTNNENFQDKDEVIKNWIKSQDRLNLDNKIKIFKTHNYLCSRIVQNENYSFTNLENSIGAIHIVRDPRTVITSIKYHFSIDTYDEALDMMNEEKTWTGLKKEDVPEVMSSWKAHYQSWKKFPKNYKLIKYENLLSNPKEEIIDLIKYLNQFFKININNKKIDTIIKNTSFKNLKNIEIKKGFDEQVINEKTKKKINFFYLGPKNNWKEILSYEITKKIEKSFHNEMKELGYI